MWFKDVESVLQVVARKFKCGLMCFMVGKGEGYCGFMMFCRFLLQFYVL